jgi:hypothetical protein
MELNVEREVTVNVDVALAVVVVGLATTVAEMIVTVFVLVVNWAGLVPERSTVMKTDTSRIAPIARDARRTGLEPSAPALLPTFFMERSCLGRGTVWRGRL